jgi:hypothetical protein
MQLIRAINKSNKSNNNNNQTSSANNNNKVVIVAPPATHSSSSVSQKVQKSAASSAPTPAPVSPSVALPALKKRTTIVKQSVPPPVPPRGSPRASKSKLISRRNQNKKIDDVDRCYEQSGCQKVKRWLETIELPEHAEVSIPEHHVETLSVKKLIESFSLKFEDDDDENVKRRTFGKGCKVSDSSSFVRLQVKSFNSLEHGTKSLTKLNHPTVRSSTTTDSGIDMPASRQIACKRRLSRSMNQFSRDGEFV